MTGPAVYDAIVLAGGSGRRLGGADKAAVRVGDRTLLDRVLDAVAGARRVVVVGPDRALPSLLLSTSEYPPGGGPVAGLAAGLALVDAPLVAVLACDLPFVTAATLAALHEALLSATETQPAGPPTHGSTPPGSPTQGSPIQGSPPDGAELVDDAGRRQPLAALYRTVALRAAVARLDPVADAPMRQVTSQLTMLDVQAAPAQAWDCDTWADVERARRRVDEQLVEEP